MKKFILLSQYVLLITAILLLLSVHFLSAIQISYMFSFCLFSLLACFVFISGVLLNKKEVYTKNITIYIMLYFLLLFFLTLLVGRPNIGFIDISSLNDVLSSINFIPFRTILGYLFDMNDRMHVVYNLLGNLIAFMPLSFLLLLKDETYYHFKHHISILFITVFSVELIQLLTQTGSFDIDDFILNIGGALLMYVLLLKFGFTVRIKPLFYHNLSLKHNISLTLFGLFGLFIVVACAVMLIAMNFN